MNKEVSEWIRFVKMDLQSADYLRTLHPMPVEIICYHYQQAAEKALKALILDFKLPGGIPKIHDVGMLLTLLKNNVEIPDEFFDYAEMLTIMASKSRYPGEIQLDENMAEMAERYAKQIYDFALELLNT